MLRELARKPDSATTYNRMIIEVADKHSLPYNFVASRARADIVAQARAEFYYMLRLHTRMSYSAIAKRVGRDHTTVIHSVKAHCLRNGLDYPQPEI